MIVLLHSYFVFDLTVFNAFIYFLFHVKHTLRKVDYRSDEIARSLKGRKDKRREKLHWQTRPDYLRIQESGRGVICKNYLGSFSTNKNNEIQTAYESKNGIRRK